MAEPLTCAWCDQAATREVEVQPPRTTNIRTNLGRSKITGLSHREPACEDHAHPEQRTDPPPTQERRRAARGTAGHLRRAQGRGGMSVIDHPPHYTNGTIEPIDVIEDWNLGFHLGNALKYIARADHKGTPVVDLKKAAWYLDREIERREAQAPARTGS